MNQQEQFQLIVNAVKACRISEAYSLFHDYGERKYNQGWRDAANAAMTSVCDTMAAGGDQ